MEVCGTYIVIKEWQCSERVSGVRPSLRNINTQRMSSVEAGKGD